MRVEVRSALVGIALMLASSGSANAALSRDQVLTLEGLVASGDVFAIVEFWNANAGSFTFDSPLELALADFVGQVNQTGRAENIPESLVQAARDESAIY